MLVFVLLSMHKLVFVQMLVFMQAIVCTIVFVQQCDDVIGQRSRGEPTWHVPWCTRWCLHVPGLVDFE